MASTVWSFSYFLFFYSWCLQAPYPTICKSGGTCTTVPYGVGVTVFSLYDPPSGLSTVFFRPSLPFHFCMARVRLASHLTHSGSFRGRKVYYLPRKTAKKDVRKSALDIGRNIAADASKKLIERATKPKCRTPSKGRTNGRTDERRVSVRPFVRLSLSVVSVRGVHPMGN